MAEQTDQTAPGRHPADGQARPDGQPERAGHPALSSPIWTAAPPDQDSLSRAITRLAAPMALADVFSLMVMVGIVVLMAHMSGVALYIRALYVPLVNLFVALYSGIGYSNQVAAAISRGRGRPGDVAPLAWSFARIWLVLSAAILVLIVAAAPLLATVLNVTAAHRDTYESFVRWMAPAELAQVGSVICGSSLRGFGKTKAGAAVSLVTALMEFGGVGVFGLVLGQGMFAVPASIAGGSLAGLGFGIFLLRRHGLWRGPEWRKWRPESLAYLRQVGLPVAITQLILAIGNLGLLWDLRGLGTNVVSGFSAAITLQLLLIMPGVVLGSAIAIVLNQQRAAGKSAWMAGGLRAGMQNALALYTFIGVVAFVGQVSLSLTMTNNPKIAAQTGMYLTIVGLTYVVQGPVLTALTCMEQLGAGPLAVGLNIVYYVITVFIGRLVVHSFGADGLYWTIAAANMLGIGVVATAFLVVRRLSSQPSRAVA